MFGGLLQPGHLVLILVIVLILVGPGKLPDVAKGVGKSIREFKTATKDVTEPITEVREQVESIKRLPAETLVGVSPNGAAHNNGAVAQSAAPVPASAAKVCTSCSTANPAGNAFCSQCGTRLA
ncbi:MAG TPA: twin-arginine translocase TatA/TatE family subunit [Chloroflexota bacterium]